MRKFWGKFKRGVRSVVGKVKRRYYQKKSGLNVGRIASDLAFVKSIVNAEKRRIDVTAYGQVVGQANHNNPGMYYSDITPMPSQGTGYNGRDGSSIKLHSSYVQMQVYGQSAQQSTTRFKAYLLQVKGVAQNPSTVAGNFLEQNQFINSGGTANFYDYNSSINPDFFGQFKVLRTFKFVLKSDNFSSQESIKTISFGMKYNRGKGHHIRFQQNSTTVSDGQIVLVIVCDTGNCSTSSASTVADIPVTAVNTGFNLQYNIKHFYYDN